jgi:D-lactate dehydrogenase (cytochrome)
MSIEAAVAELSSLLGPRLSRSKSDRETHGRSETHFPLTPPDAVAYPDTTEEVSRLAAICDREGCPVIPWGTGTSLEGHSLAPRGGVTVDFSRMDRVLDVRPQDMDCTIQPGVTRSRLNEELRATGLMFPVDPGADASLGGMASTRASGTTAVRYGTMRDNVMGLEVVLADGRVIRTGSRARKSSAGYDLTALFVGAEGTLGLVTELTLRLHGVPEATAAAVCAFPGVAAAVDAVIATIQSGVPMARIELVDAETARVFNAATGAGWAEAPHLMVEFHGTEAGAKEEAARFVEIAEEFGATGARWSTREEDRRALWRMRHDAYWTILASRPGSTAIVTDLCVPISRLAEAVEETRADIAGSGIPGPMLGHVGDGNVHAILLVKDAAEMETARRLADRMAERALRLGGTVTGEHGVGMGKLGFMDAEHGAAWDAMGALKRALDPNGTMNPGKMVRGD